MYSGNDAGDHDHANRHHELLLMPAMMAGIAKGRWTFVEICQPVTLVALPSAMNTSDVMRMPSGVRQSAGGSATIKIAKQCDSRQQVNVRCYANSQRPRRLFGSGEVH
jgi:hypothetical protein